MNFLASPISVGGIVAMHSFAAVKRVSQVFPTFLSLTQIEITLARCSATIRLLGELACGVSRLAEIESSQ